MSGQPVRVLVVDDSSTQRTQLVFDLEEAGFEVWSAGSGDEALAVARAQAVDVVVSDIVMPGLDGFGLCDRIRHDDHLGHLPVILLTAMTDPMDVLRALEAGADGFVRKPYALDQLIARIGAILETAARRAETPPEAGVAVHVAGRDHYLTHERLQLLDALGGSIPEVLELLPHRAIHPDGVARVLVVDDSPTERARATFVAEEAGAHVTAVPDGRAALAALEAALGGSEFDLVVTDVVMPGLDGVGLVRAIRADARFRCVPVIMVTSLPDPEAVTAGLDAGATCFIRKPYDDEVLGSRVRALVAGRLGRLRRPSSSPINLDYGGRRFTITADRMQMLDLLVASYDHTVGQNLELRQVQDQLQHLNQRLEERVEERTRELSQALDERITADTRRREIEAQLHAAQRAEGIGALAGGIAHDFNNLLSVILGFTEMATDQLPEGSSAREDLAEAIRAAERAAALTGQLLAFSRKQNLKPVALDLNEVTRNATGMLRRIVGEDIRLVEDLAPQLGLVLADPTQVQQVIVNIVANARDAMPAGGTLQITTANVAGGPDGWLSPVVTGRGVMLAFRDSGMGMDHETLDRIFEPFYTTKGPGKGTGLGMATVFGIVRQSGGDIRVESAPGEGTTIRVLLPRLEAADGPGEIVGRQRPSRDHGWETILVVEDEPAVRTLAARMLRAAGYTVLEAGSGEEAAAISQRQASIQLLLCDVVMPGLSGPDVAIGFAERHPTAAVLFMSGYTDDQVAHHGLRPEQAPLLGKPFGRSQLLEAVREALDGRP